MYYSVLAERDEKKVQMALDHARGYIQAAVAKALRLRYTPHIAFFFDRSVAYSIHISKKIDEALGRRDPS